MKALVYGLQLIVTRRDSRRVVIASTLIFFFLLLLVQNGPTALSVFSFNILPLYKRITLSLLVLFDIMGSFTAGTLILATLGSLLGGINISLAYTYIRMRGEVIIRSGLYSGLGLVLAFLGVGCVACGTALLSVILSFFGFSTMLNLLPYKGQEIGYIGIIFLSIATYSLAKKVAEPNVC